MNETVRISSVFDLDQDPLVLKIEDGTLYISGLSGDRRIQEWVEEFKAPGMVEYYLDKVKMYDEEPSLLSAVFQGAYTKTEWFPLDGAGVKKYDSFLKELSGRGTIRTVMVKLPTVTNEKK